MTDPFPGFEACMRMMRDHDSFTAEDGFHWLLGQAGEFVDELVVEFHSEANVEAGLRFWLLELLAEARSPALFPLFAECLYGPDPLLRIGALLGLSRLDTEEARRALREARSHSFPDPQQDEDFHQALSAMAEGRAR